MTIPRVFIPQIVTKYDAKLRCVTSVYDFGPAAEYGMLRVILDKDVDPMYLDQVTPKIREALADFRAHDYFVAVGDPSVIALCSAIILREHSVMKMLKWDKKISRYLPLELKP